MGNARAVSLGIAVGLVLAGTPAAAGAQEVAEVDVAPPSLTLAVGERKEVLASAYSGAGDIVSTAFNWVSRNPEVVRVEEDPSVPGVAFVIGVAPGVASVEVRVGNQSRAVAVQVTGTVVRAIAGPAAAGPATALEVEPTALLLMPGEDVQLRPIFLKNDGSLAAPAPMTWRSFRPEVATVDRTGQVVAISVGRGVVEAATTTGLQKRITVQVEAAEWAFERAAVSISPTESDTVRLVVPAQRGRAFPPRLLSWRSLDPDVVTVSPNGVATAISAGEAALVASGFGKEERIPVFVHRPIASLEVRPGAVDTVAVPLMGSAVFEAVALAADDTPIPEAKVVWTLTDTAVAAFDRETGVLEGRAIGTAALTVTTPDGEIGKTWVVRVVGASVVLDAETVGLALDAEVQLQASFADAAGRILTRAAGLEWSSSDDAIARVTEGGVIVATGPGSATVVARTEWGAADSVRVFSQGALLFTSTRTGVPDVYAYQPGRDAAPWPVLQSGAQDLAPALSPDGTRIAFISDRAGTFDLYVADADGANPARLGAARVNPGRPQWTADGEQLVYESTADGTLQIWIVDADGRDARQLTAGRSPSMQPAVSPAGGTIAYTAAIDGNYEIYLMDLDGGNPRNFTASSDREVLPGWMGDSALTFVREEGRGRSATRRLVRMNLDRQSTYLTGERLDVADYSIGAGGAVVAAVVELPSPRGGVSRSLFLMRVDGGGAPHEVPKGSETDQLVTPFLRP